MRNLTKLFIAVLIITMASESFAQRFAVVAGLNLSNMIMKDDDDTYSDEFKMRPGFHVGLTVQIPKTGLVSFETGLILSTKGFKVKEEETYQGEKYTYEGSINLYYIDIPLMAKFSFEVGEVTIFAAIGPYLGVGLSGKTKTKYSYQGEEETDSEKIDWGSDAENDMLKRFDFGLSIGAGVVIIKAIQIGLSYDLGLANISSYSDDGTKINNRVFKVSVGYRFGGK